MYQTSYWGDGFRRQILTSCRHSPSHGVNIDTCIIPRWSRRTKYAKCTFACLARMVLTWKGNNLRFTAAGWRCRQNLKYDISRRCLADYVKNKKLQQTACRTCSTIFFPYLIQPILKSLICGVVVAMHCRRHSLNSLLKYARKKQ